LHPAHPRGAATQVSPPAVRRTVLLAAFLLSLLAAFVGLHLLLQVLELVIETGREPVLFCGGDLIALRLKKPHRDIPAVVLHQPHAKAARRQILDAFDHREQFLVGLNATARQGLPAAPGPVLEQFLPLELNGGKGRIGQARIAPLFLLHLHAVEAGIEPSEHLRGIEPGFDRHQIDVVGLGRGRRIRHFCGQRPDGNIRRCANVAGRHVRHVGDLRQPVLPR